MNEHKTSLKHKQETLDAIEEKQNKKTFITFIGLFIRYKYTLKFMTSFLCYIELYRFKFLRLYG